MIMNLDSKLILETLKNNLNRVPYVHLAIIYGSTVSGTLKPSSDIDLAIATGKKITSNEKIEIFHLMSEGLPLAIDLVDLQTTYGLLLNQIMISGKILKNTRPIIRAKLLTRMLTEKEDWLPIQEKIRKAHVIRFIHE